VESVQSVAQPDLTLERRITPAAVPAGDAKAAQHMPAWLLLSSVRSGTVIEAASLSKSAQAPIRSSMAGRVRRRCQERGHAAPYGASKGEGAHAPGKIAFQMSPVDARTAK
jgi:hypothetical protein